MRWPAKIVSLCTAKCAVTNMDSVGAGVAMDPRLIEKTKAVQDYAWPLRNPQGQKDLNIRA